MKKVIILLSLGLLSFVANAQLNQLNTSIFKPSTNDVFAMNITKTQNGFNPMNTIDLRLKGPKYQDPDQNKSTGMALLLGGIAFTTAAILESGDFKIYQGETARQIMLGVGIGLTLTGGVISLKK